MQLDKSDGGFEKLIPEHVIQWTSDTGCGEVMDDQEDPNSAKQDGAHKNRNDDLRRTFATPSGLSR
jgi:hypothetical protein